MTGRSWAARCPELFGPGPHDCGGGGGATSLGRSAFWAAPATQCAFSGEDQASHSSQRAMCGHVQCMKLTSMRVSR